MWGIPENLETERDQGRLWSSLSLQIFSWIPFHKREPLFGHSAMESELHR